MSKLILPQALAEELEPPAIVLPQEIQDSVDLLILGIQNGCVAVARHKTNDSDQVGYDLIVYTARGPIAVAYVLPQLQIEPTNEPSQAAVQAPAAVD